ncbi:MAG: formamidopyrimidine-DNA glycosylase [Patescibacteria group bacterium]|nr:MAG: formamidopyrimidine-DNA glycosylase [Patescibacteria group bacterium]
MPELPEVETIKKQLEGHIIGKQIADIRLFDKLSHNKIKVSVANETVENIVRLGKGLIIQLSNQKAIALHLKMTGQLLYTNKSRFNLAGTVIQLPNKHTKAVIIFTDNTKLFFNDIRRFGWIKVDKLDAIKSWQFFIHLGQDALKILYQDFFELVSNSNQSIKDLILDQSKIAGIGNIYANDALFLAKINPFKKAKQLKSSDIKALYQSMKIVLAEGINHKGTSKLNFVDIFGQKGNYQKHALVYNKEGQLCPNNCGAKIKRLKQKGRSSFFCPNCQK